MDRGPDDDDERTGRAIPVRGSLMEGGSFTGRVEQLELTPQKSQVVPGQFSFDARGKISGRVRRANGTKARIDQTFETVVTLTSAAASRGAAFQVTPAQAQPCSVLVIEFGVIAVQVLQGTLNLKLSLISIDLTANGLLGSLLCGLVQLRV
jgi:hypothetical protein